MTWKDLAKRVLGPARASEIAYRRRLHAYGETYLKPIGWQHSVVRQRSVNADGPVPWITYPALRQLERVVQPHHRVFEYGAGHSSLWWAARVREIVSVEHDPAWAAEIGAAAPANLTVVSRPAGAPATADDEARLQVFFDRYPEPPRSGQFARDVDDGLEWGPFTAYLTEIARYPPGTFDIVVVDGMARAPAAWLAAANVAPDGFIVFDNADRWQYGPGYEALADAGFARLDFFGTRPILVDESCTAIYARSLAWARARLDVPRHQPSDLRW